MPDAAATDDTLNVLVVCTANVARSPLAAAMLADRIASRNVTFDSAGIHAADGVAAADESQRLAAERGLDLSAHRSRPISVELLKQAGLVLTMSEHQRDRCSSVVAGRAARTFTLREHVRLSADVAMRDTPISVAPRLRWLRDQAHYARPRLARPATREDIEDPIGQGRAVWKRLGRDLDELIAELHAKFTL